MTLERRPEVVIIGGGFGGLYAALSLKKAPVNVTLIDRRNIHLFQPLLYQVATSGLSAANISSPLRAILRQQKNARVLLAEAVDIDAESRKVILSDGELDYDYLVVAAGAENNYFGHPEWEALAPGLKSLEDSAEMRRRILLAFEAAERESDPEERERLLTFVVVGGGATGVELAGALSEMAHRSLPQDFRAIRADTAKIFLVEGGDRVLATYPEKLSTRARTDLERYQVTVLTENMVTNIKPDCIELKSKEKGSWRICCRTVLWAAGVKASPLVQVVARISNQTPAKDGRVIVENDLRLPGRDHILVIGDMASCAGPGGEPLPGVAPVAMQEGRYAARRIVDLMAGRPTKPFRYHNRGSMATIGRAAAVADLKYVQLTGVLAWLVWLFVHLLYLVQFENRLLVLIQWAWHYFTFSQASRLILGKDILPLLKKRDGEAACRPGAPKDVE